MATDQLQQLRDIHLPPAPGWWPPAPGWWLLGMVLLAAFGWSVWWLWQRRRRGRPFRQARRLYDDAYRRYCAGELSAREYLDASNELLKRILIHGVGERAARRATGRPWLELLDRHLGAAEFSRGPGRLLGDARFHPRLDGDPAEVHPLVQRLLARLSPSAAERAS